MSRIDDDIMKIKQIIGDNYTDKIGKSAFVVFTEGGELSAIRVGAISGGDMIPMLHAVSQELSKAIANAGKDWDVVQIIHRGVVAFMEENEKKIWQEKHGQAETAGKEMSHEEQLAARIKGDATA